MNTRCFLGLFAFILNGCIEHSRPAITSASSSVLYRDVFLFSAQKTQVVIEVRRAHCFSEVVEVSPSAEIWKRIDDSPQSHGGVVFAGRIFRQSESVPCLERIGRIVGLGRMKRLKGSQDSERLFASTLFNSDSNLPTRKADRTIFRSTVGLMAATGSSDDAGLSYLFCGATKVASRLFITAAHCLSRETIAKPMVPKNIYFDFVLPGKNIQIVTYRGGISEGLGNDSVAIDSAKVKRIHVHPSWLSDGDKGFDPELKMVDADVGFIETVEDVAVGVPSAEIALEHLDVSSKAILQGFDCSLQAAGGAGLVAKEVVMSGIAGSAWMVRSEERLGNHFAGTCPGDSGTALFSLQKGSSPKIVGINSRFVNDSLLLDTVQKWQGYFTRFDKKSSVPDAGKWAIQTLENYLQTL